jgi:hypothetical protein
MKNATKSRGKQLVLLVWVLVLIFYVYISYDYVRVQLTDDKFADALQHIVQVAGTERRTYKEIRSLVLVRAEDLGLPIRVEQIAIKGSGPSLNVTVDYDVDIDIPIFRHGFYSKHYEQKAAYRQGF